MVDEAPADDTSALGKFIINAIPPRLGHEPLLVDPAQPGRAASTHLAATIHVQRARTATAPDVETPAPGFTAPGTDPEGAGGADPRTRIAEDLTACLQQRTAQAAAAIDRATADREKLIEQRLRKLTAIREYGLASSALVRHDDACKRCTRWAFIAGRCRVGTSLHSEYRVAEALLDAAWPGHPGIGRHGCVPADTAAGDAAW